MKDNLKREFKVRKVGIEDRKKGIPVENKIKVLNTEVGHATSCYGLEKFKIG